MAEVNPLTREEQRRLAQPRATIRDWIESVKAREEAAAQRPKRKNRRTGY